MMLIAIADWGLGCYGYSFMMTNYYDHLYIDNQFGGYFWSGLGFDIGFSFFLRVFLYGHLALKWEGYEGHRFYHFLHYFTILMVSLFPYGDFLLHLGYRHNGILS